jgi:EAL domain-containing protein (putative c-di-GMP-specific phosphodiesterase class I)
MDHNIHNSPAAFPDLGGRLKLVAGARDDWVARIDDALKNGRFVLHAQPVLELSTDRVVLHELLIRMRDTAAGGALIAPVAFVPIAEQTGLIGRIDRWVIGRAAELAGAGLPVAVNVSARSIEDPQLITHIESALARTGANPQRMVFEVTETGLIGDSASAGAFAARMRELGCRIALDDFGTGWSCLHYVKQLQADALKIDAEFVWDIASSPASRAVVRAIVNLARGFGMTTVAEGVEDEPTLETVRGLGVEHAQGYHIARPGPLSLVLSEIAPC